MNDFEQRALSYMPIGLRENIRRTMALYRGNVSEIRLRAGNPVYITVNSKNVSCGVIITYDELSRVVRQLCGNSMYSHSETIRDGYICVEGGIRVGVCGRAVTEKGQIIAVTDITSVSIRIPHRISGVADTVVKSYIEDPCGMLIFSEPGVGKTTVIREFAARLASQPFNMRVAVIDTRFEICGALSGKYSIDVLGGYPRAKGIETALRTMSPQLIICDEIGSPDESAAIIDSAGAGVPIIATAHAGNSEELMSREHISTLIEHKIFGRVWSLSRNGDKLSTVMCEELC